MIQPKTISERLRKVRISRQSGQSELWLARGINPSTWIVAVVMVVEDTFDSIMIP
jgi:hypothetical protein